MWMTSSEDYYFLSYCSSWNHGGKYCLENDRSCELCKLQKKNSLWLFLVILIVWKCCGQIDTTSFLIFLEIKQFKTHSLKFHSYEKKNFVIRSQISYVTDEYVYKYLDIWSLRIFSIIWIVECGPIQPILSEKTRYFKKF